MTTIQRLFLGHEASAFEQGHSLHGRWRAAYQQADAPDEERTPAALAIVQDAARFVFVLAEGPAAAIIAEELADRLWTLEKVGDDWPAPLTAWLTDRALWHDAPAGPACFAAGRLDRQQPVGAIALAWLGCAGIRLLDRALLQVEAEHPAAAGGAWSPEDGIVPDSGALGWQRSSLFGLDRLVVVSNGATPLAADLPDMALADVRQALLDWGAEAAGDLALLDLHLAPVVSQPSAVALTCRWIAPQLCELRWNPSPNATAYRLEVSAAPDFASPSLLAELTDGRQIVYRFPPPPDRTAYYRVVPLNQGVAGPPSEAVCPLPLAMTAPVLLPAAWSADGGPALRWTPIPQATGYEVQESVSERFENSEATVVYRGEQPACELPPDTPAGRFYRARALNALYAPETPSPWSEPIQAPAHLDTPVFTRVTSERLAWTPVSGARAYVLHITPQGQDEGQGEDITVSEPSSAVAHVHATYRVRAQRAPNDTRSASEWSAPATVAPPGAAGSPPSGARPVGSLIVGAALVALLVGAALGVVGLRAYQDANATATPDSAATHEAVRAAFAADLTATADAFTATPSPTPSASPTRTPIPSATPDSAATHEAVRAAFAADLTATADAFTATPSPTPSASPTRTPIPSATPDSAATHEAVRAAFAADLTATANAFTATPSPTPSASPTRTPVPSATPDSAATAAALLAVLDVESCLLVNLDDLPLPALSGPYAGDRQIAAQASRLARVVEQVTLRSENGEQVLWLRVAPGTGDAAGAGWVRVPTGADLARLLAGPGCPGR